ncbi:RtcB family protein [Herbaspirillum seropedicae]|uniref:RtcB family protein n=1 Tax=Herbaspirillum seropedicae TaxID=964 RepID=UPI003F8D3849
MEQQTSYDTLAVEQGTPVKMWTRGVPVEAEAKVQLSNTAKMPFIYKHIAVMPDVHVGKGSTIGSVIPTLGAIIPAAVGVDIGCGMMAAKTTLRAADLPDNLGPLRSAIERAIPHGSAPRTRHHRGRDQGSWENPPTAVDTAWQTLQQEFEVLCQKTPKLEKTNHYKHLGTLGSGNHFIEVCLDEEGAVWFMLHSGSRGVGNAIGTHFIALAQQDMRTHMVNLPDRDLAYLKEGSKHYEDYLQAVGWAQKFARTNREVMMHNLIAAVRSVIAKPFQTHVEAVNCHHNYVQKEQHFGQDVLVTRKGAVSARAGELGIIPGSMGARSFIVRGKGEAESFHSCSHGAGRTMSRTEARKRFSVDDHIRATAGVECRKDEAVIDEIPMAYKDIDAVMQAQHELVEVVHTLRQIVCVKG